jgi:hypothetical protein
VDIIYEILRVRKMEERFERGEVGMSTMKSGSLSMQRFNRLCRCEHGCLRDEPRTQPQG